MVVLFQMMILVGCRELVFDLRCLKMLLRYFSARQSYHILRDGHMIKELLALFVIPDAFF